MHVLVLRRAVGCQELAAHVDDRLVVPHDAHARLGRDLGDDRRLQVLLASVAQEFVHVIGGDGARHALLRFGNGKLGSVEAVIFLGNLVQVDAQPIGKLADGHRNAARAEVVAALDQAACLAAAEQALDLALLGRVALLHLGAAGLQAVEVVLLGRTRRAADAVAAGSAAQKHDDIARSRGFATHVIGRRGRHDCADLHALGNIAGMIQLVDLACCKTDLIAVAGIARSGRGDQLALRQLAGKRLGNGRQRVCRTGHAHGLIHVAAPGQWIANGSAQTRRRAAERLDLGGMVVRLVLEQVQPILILAVDVNRALHRAGVDLLRLVQAGQDALRFQPFRADGAHVHQAHRLLSAAQLVAHGLIAIPSGLHALVVDGNLGHLGAEGGVAAVIGPVGVDHLDFRDGGAATLFGEVALAEGDVGQVHGQAPLVDEGGQARLVKLQKSPEHLHRLRGRLRHVQRLALGERRLARLDRVDDVMLDGGKGLVGAAALDDDDPGKRHIRALPLADQLNALRSGVGALVELARQRLDREHAPAGRIKRRRGVVNLRLAEHRRHALLEQGLVDALDIVTVDHAQARIARKALGNSLAKLREQLAGLNVEAGLLLHVDAGNHGRPFHTAGTTPKTSADTQGVPANPNSTFRRKRA